MEVVVGGSAEEISLPIYQLKLTAYIVVQGKFRRRPGRANLNKASADDGQIILNFRLGGGGSYR